MTRMLCLLAIACLFFTSLGCQSFSEMELSWVEEKPSYKKPTELVAIWQDGVDTQLDPRQGGQAVPGFAGRVLFMHQPLGHKAETVAVDGTVVVQLFEDKAYTGPTQPLETWTIKPEHLPLMMKRDLSGWGYSLWLPWTSCNPAIRSGKLIVQFTGKEGLTLQSPPMPVQMSDAHQGGIARPQLNVQQFRKNTWEK